MYILQVVNNVHIGEHTGIVNKYVSHFQAETLKPLLLKADKIINEKSYNCFLNFSFYQVSNEYLTEIISYGNYFEKLEDKKLLLYFCMSGMRCDDE